MYTPLNDVMNKVFFLFSCTKYHLEQYKWKRCSNKKCCKQCAQVKFKGTMAKWPVQKHTEHNQKPTIDMFT